MFLGALRCNIVIIVVVILYKYDERPLNAVLNKIYISQ